MNPEETVLIKSTLAQVVEGLEIHHERKDGDWLRPQDLRQILRLMYFLLIDTTDPYEVLPSD